MARLIWDGLERMFWALLTAGAIRWVYRNGGEEYAFMVLAGLASVAINLLHEINRRSKEGKE